MNIPQWFVPKKRLIKVAQNRVTETLQYVNIDNSVKAGDKELLSGYRESLARFAKRHNIAINFKTAETNNNVTEMQVYKTHLTRHSIERKNQGNWFLVTPEYRASAELPKNRDKNHYNNLKDMIKELADADSNIEQNQRFPKRIRHENKYYEWVHR